MRYLPTIDLWAPGMTTALRSGQLKLQPGQWVYAGNKQHKSRFIDCNKHSINAVHWQGSSARTAAKFRDRIKSKQMEKLYKSNPAAWRIAMAEWRQEFKR